MILDLWIKSCQNMVIVMYCCLLTDHKMIGSRYIFIEIFKILRTISSIQFGILSVFCKPQVGSYGTSTISADWEVSGYYLSSQSKLSILVSTVPTGKFTWLPPIGNPGPFTNTADRGQTLDLPGWLAPTLPI